MNDQIQVIRGMHDILPVDMPVWNQLEDSYRRLAESYGYQQIRTPIVEKTALFQRSIGEVTDIVEKEMYSFSDRNGDSLSLRPENTAGVVRAGLENGLLNDAQLRLWYWGPMFRHERPQKGRYRQFYQLGAETFGMAGADIEAELIFLAERFWNRLGLQGIELQINSLGSSECRNKFRQKLVTYFRDCYQSLDEDSARRLETNPLRILDSKNPEMQSLIDAAPRLIDNLDQQSSEHFSQLTEILDYAGVSYELNPRLVRGLDYYCHTVFEWVTNTLGAQGTPLSSTGGPRPCRSRTSGALAPRSPRRQRRLRRTRSRMPPNRTPEASSSCTSIVGVRKDAGDTRPPHHNRIPRNLQEGTFSPLLVEQVAVFQRLTGLPRAVLITHL